MVAELGLVGCIGAHLEKGGNGTSLRKFGRGWSSRLEADGGCFPLHWPRAIGSHKAVQQGSGMVRLRPGKVQEETGVAGAVMKTGQPLGD